MANKRNDSLARQVCTKCGKEKVLVDFWSHRDGTRFSICKDCASKTIDVSKPTTFMWILEEADIPFVEDTWINLCKRKFAKDPERFNAKAAVGTYLRTMRNIPRFKDYGFKDTNQLNKENIEKRKKQREENDQLEKEVISDNSIEKTEPILNEDKVLDLTITEEDKHKGIDIAKERRKRREKKKAKYQLNIDKDIEKEMDSQDMAELVSIDEQSLLDGLTQNDIQYLSLKWGESFRPSEWIKMEEMYNKYSQEFEIGVDRESVLIAMCKTSINMQRCLDAGDATNGSKFSSMFDQLRKSGAFTEAQKKEEKERYLDSVGELVAAVEREGGVIPQFDYQFEVNQDKVDLTLKDMQSYTYNLVKNEMGLGDLIETYIKKLDQQREEEQNKNLSDGLVTSSAEEQQTADDKFADDWLRNLEDSIAADADSIYSRVGEDDENGS